MPRGASPALLRFPESNRIVAQPNDRVERQLVVRLVALAREARSVPPETRAAEILVAAHPALCHNTNVGGLALALGLRELDCEWVRTEVIEHHEFQSGSRSLSAYKAAGWRVGVAI